MIRPHVFYSNPETAHSNEFQATDSGVSAREAQIEFEGLARTLRNHGVEVLVVDDTPHPATPDAVFPNNWLSTHADGTVVTYPMQAPSRRAERRADILDDVFERHGFVVNRHIDLAHFEDQQKYLEGTGSLVLDRLNRVAYACLSPRTCREVVEDFARQLGYDTVVFRALGVTGRAIYHTNVMMCIGTAVAVVCLESIHADDRGTFLERLSPGRDVVSISAAQMREFAGNMLELRAADGEPVVVMSSRARASLSAEQARRLRAHARLIHAPINAIENASGGSVRCKLAEIFLPKRDPQP